MNIDTEVNLRIAKANTAFGRLRETVWERRDIRLSTKLKVYRFAALSSLLYTCETWTVYERYAKVLNRFHLNCLRKLLKITWRDKVPDTEVLSRTALPSIYTLLKRTQVRWAGHLVRMPDIRLPKKMFYGELAEGKRSQGGQKKRYKDCLKASLKGFDISTETWETQALDRLGWRGKTCKGVIIVEHNRLVEAQWKRKIRKSKAASFPPAQGKLPVSSLWQGFPCPYWFIH